MTDLLRITRTEFLDKYWDYRPGEHVTIIAPTGWGKSQWQNELLRASATPDLPAVVMAMKPRDKTIDKLARETRWPIVRDWPAPYLKRVNKPSGFIVWPKHAFDPDVDNARHYGVFRRAILESYKHGRRILVGDEFLALTQDLTPKLDRELSTVWNRGRSMECGLWGGSQRPAHIPLAAYSQASHIFLGLDPDKRGLDRFKEIGGIDPVTVVAAVKSLKRFEWLYVGRHGGPGGGPSACIIGRS